MEENARGKPSPSGFPRFRISDGFLLVACFGALLGAPVASLPGAPEVQEDAAPSDASSGETLGVMLVRPGTGEAAVGTVDLEAEAWPPDNVERVLFLVDGASVGEVASPPYRLTVEMGPSAESREIEAVAIGRTGLEARDSLRTEAIRIDLALDLPLRQLYVTVTRDGRRLGSIPRGAFEVRDQGKAQELVTFERGDVPLTAVLLVDSSLSMQGGRLAAALAGVEVFVQGMQELDEAKIMLFSDRLLHSTPFTRFREILTAGLDGVTAAGGTAVNDHLYRALKDLESRQGRRVVVILSDGVDVESALSIEDVLWKVKYSQALVYWLRLHRDGQPLLDGNELVTQYSWWRDADEHKKEFKGLEEAVAASGGRIADLYTLNDIAPAFQDILDELRGQYVLGYYPTTQRHDGTWRRIRVSIQGGGVEVRTREGYLDF